MLTSAATLNIARILRAVRYGTATGGSGTTLVDTLMNEPNDWFNGGTIWFLSAKTTPSGTEPTNMSAVVTDWALSTTTFTFAALAGSPAASVGAGVRYAVIDNIYRREMLLQGLNEALTELGPFLAINAATTTVADTESYSLPAGVTNVKRVEIATSTTSPYAYYEYRYWREVAGTIYFDLDHLPPAGYKIRLWYEDEHAVVNADTDVVSDELHPDLVRWTAAVHIIQNRLGVTQGSEPQLKELLTYAQQQAQIMRMRHPVRKVQKDSRWPSFTTEAM